MTEALDVIQVDTSVPAPIPAPYGGTEFSLEQPLLAAGTVAAPGGLADRVDEVDGPLQIVEITDVTHDVKSFTLSHPDGTPLDFAPGQYLTLRFDLDGEPVERCYTISSAPSSSPLLTVTIKRVAEGPVSSLAHERLQVGDTVHALGPHGVFSHTLHQATKLLFLSAGSGITPLMSMLRSIRDSDAEMDVAFVHFARSPRDLIFRAELEAAAADPRISVSLICDRDDEEEAWAGVRGRLSLPILLGEVPDLLDREAFTCGPPGFMAAAAEFLDLLGIGADRLHAESFDLSGGAPPAEQPTVTGIQHRVEFAKSGTVVDCDESTTILSAAAQAGLTLPSSCGEGVCGTCKFSMLAGKVDMQHGGGIRKREIEAGKILLCSSKPQEDIVIDG